MWLYSSHLQHPDQVCGEPAHDTDTTHRYRRCGAESMVQKRSAAPVWGGAPAPGQVAIASATEDRISTAAAPAPEFSHGRPAFPKWP